METCSKSGSEFVECEEDHGSLDYMFHCWKVVSQYNLLAKRTSIWNLFVISIKKFWWQGQQIEVGGYAGMLTMLLCIPIFAAIWGTAGQKSVARTWTSWDNVVHPWFYEGSVMPYQRSYCYCGYQSTEFPREGHAMPRFYYLYPCRMGTKKCC